MADPAHTDHQITKLDLGPGPWESYLDLPDQVEDEASLRTALHWPLLET